MMARKHAWTTVLALALTLTGGVTAAAAPADTPDVTIMSPSSGWVDGNGGTANQWANEGVLGQNYHRNSGATGLWQAFLYTQGYLVSLSDIDCQFGPNTATATANFQAANGLSDDGVVGAATFGRADDYLTFESTEGGGTSKYYHAGSGARKLYFPASVSGSTWRFGFKQQTGKYGVAYPSWYGSIPTDC
ncbi:peptidoglycan-binding protein [Promicromonospora sp. NPDC050880]|uniref:peptidoglycan-binding domain-containing protein n=1 Tax=unclassified Promicromonospora TaxID=2647929 RepID=UPI0037BB42F7